MIKDLNLNSKAIKLYRSSEGKNREATAKQITIEHNPDSQNKTGPKTEGRARPIDTHHSESIKCKNERKLLKM